jgi:hypothetical protein
MWKIIMLLILIGIALYFFIAKPGYTSKEREEYVDGGYTQSRYVEVHHSLTRLGFVPLVLALLFFAMNSITQVHAKEVGVGVQFGKPVAEYDAGLHLKPFWYSVTKINGTVYTDSYGTTGAENKAIPVRLGDGNPAWASVTMRWHINPDAVDYIYATYRSNDPAGQPDGSSDQRSDEPGRQGCRRSSVDCHRQGDCVGYHVLIRNRKPHR